MDRTIATLADFKWAIMIHVDLRRGDVRSSDFRFARLDRADFRETRLSGASFAGAILSRSTGIVQPWNGL